MKFSEIVVKDKTSLYQQLVDLKKELFHLRVQAGANQVLNVKRLRECKKDVARVWTRLNQLKNKE